MKTCSVPRVTVHFVFVVAIVLADGCGARAVYPDAARDGTSEPSVSPPTPGAAGSHCTSSTDCDSSLCLPTGVCTAPCSAATDCPDGWVCTTAGSSSRCDCIARVEMC